MQFSKAVWESNSWWEGWVLEFDLLHFYSLSTHLSTDLNNPFSFNHELINQTYLSNQIWITKLSLKLSRFWILFEIGRKEVIIFRSPKFMRRLTVCNNIVIWTLSCCLYRPSVLLAESSMAFWNITSNPFSFRISAHTIFISTTNY